MNFNAHVEFEGEHAFLSPSKGYWVNYDTDKLIQTYKSFRSIQRGTELHQLAADCIKHNVKLKGRNTLAMHVNDAIGYRMKAEQPLVYSYNCFGTADAISFRRNLLRIHDLKTGIHPGKMSQLEIYMALFCLEYEKDPNKINAELRIYQSNEVHVHEPEPEHILYIMQKIKDFDKRIEALKMEEDI